MTLRLGIGLGIALTTLALPGLAWAESGDATRSAARKVALDGVAALQRGDTDAASTKLEKAYAVLKAPSVALWSARALAKRGQLVEASERYLAASRLNYSGGDQAVQEQSKQDASKELAELAPRIPSVLVVLEGAVASEVSVRLDGKAIPGALLDEERPANPGNHELVAERGTERFQQSINLAEGQKQRVVFHFTAQGAASDAAPSAGTSPIASSKSAPSSADSGAVEHAGGGRKTLAFAALGAGGVGLVVGGVAAILAQGKRSDLDKSGACRGGECLTSASSEVSSFRSLRTVSSVGFIAGGAFAATGIVLLLTSGSSGTPSDHAQVVAAPRLALQLQPSTISLEGSF